MFGQENLVMKLLCRVDASTKMGTGHLMRSLALAQAWQAWGGEAIFCVATEIDKLASRLETEGVEAVHLSVLPGSIEDAQATSDLAKHRGVSWVVVDGYHFDACYQQIIKQSGVYLLFVDDYGHAERYPADFVLNQNVDAKADLYSQRESYTQLLLGTDYVLLRKEFWSWRGWQREIPEVARKVLVTLGGSDPDNVTLKVVEALQQVEVQGLEAAVVVGGSNPHYQELATVAQKSPFPITLKQNVTNMPELMAWADVAIAAGGSTNWELAFMGLPSAIVTIADNQSAIAQQLGKMGLTLSLGWYEQQIVKKLSTVIADFLYALEQRRQMSEKGRNLVDGLGSERVVKALCEGNLYHVPARK
jgi:UDP-2,4-diacetamido-2,4,6-trideoxy-beta-L-altropyranose hydrolase